MRIILKPMFFRCQFEIDSYSSEVPGQLVSGFRASFSPSIKTSFARKYSRFTITNIPADSLSAVLGIITVLVNDKANEVKEFLVEKE